MITVISDDLGKVAVETKPSEDDKGKLIVVMQLVDEDNRKIKTFNLKVKEADFHRRLRFNKEWYIEESDEI